MTAPTISDLDECSAEAKALRALGGINCIKCAVPLPRPLTGYRVKPGETTFACCDIAHCPYCGLRSQKHCRHLLAMDFGAGSYRLYGFSTSEGALVPPSLPFKADCLLAHNDTEIETAFGVTREQARVDFKDGHAIDEWHIATKWLSRDHPVERGNFKFYFSATPDAAREHIHRKLATYRRGVEWLRDHAPEDARFITHSFGCDHRCDSLVFAPNGARLLATMPDGIWTCDLRGSGYRMRGNFHAPRLPRHFDKTTSAKSMFTHYGARYYIQVRHEMTHEVVATVLPRDSYGATNSDVITGGNGLGAVFLHELRTVVVVKGNDIHLFDADDPDRGEPAFTLHMRLPVTALAASPDGESFAVNLYDPWHGSFVIVCRVPREKVVGKSAGGADAALNARAGAL